MTLYHKTIRELLTISSEIPFTRVAEKDWTMQSFFFVYDKKFLIWVGCTIINKAAMWHNFYKRKKPSVISI